MQANMKLFMSAVKMNDVKKVETWTARGFDPNYQDVDNGGMVSLLMYISFAPRAFPCYIVCVNARNILLFV